MVRPGGTGVSPVCTCFSRDGEKGHGAESCCAVVTSPEGTPCPADRIWVKLRSAISLLTETIFFEFDMARRSKSVDSSRQRQSGESTGPLRLRIVGGEFRGRVLKYSGDRRVRPMKDRTREAIFNLLGPTIRGTYAWDLFAGTGAMGLEAISRGAIGAALLEQHIPTAKLIRENVESLGLVDRVRRVQADAFHWIASTRDLSGFAGIDPAIPWIVFCCPPYAFFAERLDAMRSLLRDLHPRAPQGSQFVIEAEIPFDFNQLWPDEWRVRNYAPATVAILEIQHGSDDPIHLPTV